MPIVKTRRRDVLRPNEILKTVETAKSLGLDWLSCAISLCCIFGKRVNEVLSLKRDQVLWNENFLIVRFIVGKKRRQTPIPEFYVKRKTVKHPLFPYIRDYVEPIKEGYIFPSGRAEQTIRQTVQIKRKDGSLKECNYEYHVPGGYIGRELAWYYLKKVAPNWWWHLARESLATRMAEEGATEEELMHWFDWETPASAHKYVKRGTKLTEKWSERTW
jgi:integrase